MQRNSLTLYRKIVSQIKIPRVASWFQRHPREGGDPGAGSYQVSLRRIGIVNFVLYFQGFRRAFGILPDPPAPGSPPPRGRRFERQSTVTRFQKNFALKYLFLALCLTLGPVVSAETLLVSNEKGNSITVLDADSLKVLRTVAVGQRPRGILLSKDKKYLYICASDDDRIDVLDLDSYTLQAPLPSGPDPETFALHPDGNHLYVSNEDNSLVSIVDIAAHRITGEISVGVEPEGMSVSPDGKWIVNTSETTNMAHFVDNDTHQVVANVLVDSRPRHAEWTSDGAQVWVSAEIGGTVSVIDSATRKVIHKITFAIPGVPRQAIQAVGIVLTKDRKLGFVALGPSNRVAVINAQTYEVMSYLLVGQRVWNLAFNHDESKLFTTNGVSNDVSAIDVKALRVVKSVTVGNQPWGVVVRP
jgi:PQQ-dependent catabolism-associated beta-propeller protein